MRQATNAVATPARGKTRGRNRSKAADEAILKATLEVLAEKGYASLTANDVISRAGVSSATLYRRWSSLGELVAAAIRTLGPEPVSIDTGGFESDMAEFIRYLGKAMSRDNLTGDLSDKSARIDKDLRALVMTTFVAPRKAILAQILTAALERKEINSVPPIDDCWSYVSGPIHHRVYIRDEPFTPAFAGAMTLLICTGLKALANS